MGKKNTVRPMWEAVGRMTSDFALLEMLIHHLVWALIGYGNAACGVVTKEMSLQQLRQLTKRLLDAGIPADKDRRKRIGELLEPLGRLNEDRNRFTHSLVTFGEIGLTLARVRELVGAKRYKDVAKEVSVSEVEELIGRCQSLVHDVVELLWEMEWRHIDAGVKGRQILGLFESQAHNPPVGPEGGRIP